MGREELKIGELAAATATKVETIRYYERVELLPLPERTSGNYRVYGQVHLERLSFIRRARGLGFSIAQVRELLGLADDPDQTCGAVDAIAREHLVAVDRKIAALTALRRELDDLIGRCARSTIAGCRIVGALNLREARPSPD